MSSRLEDHRQLIGVFAIFAVLMGASGAVLFVQKLGTTPAAVASFYRGSEEAFTQPRSLPGLLRVATPHLLAIPLTIFVVLHLVAWAGQMRRRAFALASSLTFGLALTGMVAGFAVRFLWPQAAVLKLAAFIGFEMLLAWWVGMLLVSAAAGGWAQPGTGPGLLGRPAARGRARSWRPTRSQHSRPRADRAR